MKPIWSSKRQSLSETPFLRQILFNQSRQCRATIDLASDALEKKLDEC